MGLISPNFPLQATHDAIAAIRRRLDTLEAPTGTSIGSLVSQVQAALANIDAKVQTSIAANSYTKSQIDSKIASPGAIAPTSVNASGAGTFPGGLSSVDVYSHLVTGGGQYHATYAHETGFLGYAPSSRQFKQDITPWGLDVSLLPQLRPVLYRYKADVVNNADAAQVHAGLIAEEVDALGLRELVDYDDAGKPFGIKYELVAVALVKLVQMRAAQRSHQIVTAVLPAVTIAQATTTVDVKWPTPMVDADYTVVAGVTAADGVLSSAVAYLVPGSRTMTGCQVAVRAIGVSLPPGQTLTVEGLHL